MTPKFEVAQQMGAMQWTLYLLCIFSCGQPTSAATTA